MHVREAVSKASQSTATNTHYVRGCSANTTAAFTWPSPFCWIHRPSRVSCPTPATIRTGDPPLRFAFARAGASASSSAEGAGAGRAAQGALSQKSFGGVRNWSELTTPRTAIDPMGEKDLSFASSFHRRTSPSHEPKDGAV